MFAKESKKEKTICEGKTKILKRVKLIIKHKHKNIIKHKSQNLARIEKMLENAHFVQNHYLFTTLKNFFFQH